MKTLFGRFVRLAPVAAALIGVLAGLGNLIVSGPGGVRSWDTTAVRWLADEREHGLERATAAATYLADTYPVIAATALLAALAGWWTRRWWLPAGIVLLTAGETAIYELSNTLVDRPRPAVMRLDPGDPMASFPSGHVAAAVCLYGGVAAIVLRWGRGRPGRWRVASVVAVVVAVVVPLIVAFCRTYRGMHHPADVLAGAVLGVCWLLAVDRFVLAPALAKVRDSVRGSSRPEPRKAGTARGTASVPVGALASGHRGQRR